MITRLDLHHYATVLAIVESGSMTAAADRLAVSQSAVSHRLAEAERRLGEVLFDRRPARALQPTPAGLVLAQAAERALPELVRAEHDIARAAGEAVDVVRLGVGSYDCYHWLPDYHRHASDALDDVVLELAVVGDSPGSRLRAGAVDVVLAPGSPEGQFATQHLFTDELVLVTHPEHPLGSRQYVEPEALADETYLTYSRTPAPGFEFDRFVRPSGVTPRTVLVIEDTSAIAEMVASGIGVAILSRWALTPWVDAGKVAAARCGGGLDLAWSALVRDGARTDSPEARVADDLAGWLRAEATGRGADFER